MDMDIRVSSRSPIPIFLQIAERIEYLIATGIIPKGQRLPPVRELARENGFYYKTVARAYRELAEDGLIVSAPSTGTYAHAPEDAVLIERVSHSLSLLARMASDFTQLISLPPAPARDILLASAEGQIQTLLPILDEITIQANDNTPYLRSQVDLETASLYAAARQENPDLKPLVEPYAPNFTHAPSQATP